MKLKTLVLPAGLFLLMGGMAQSALSYPLDGYLHTGIPRLEGYRLAQQDAISSRRLPKGALLRTNQVDLRLLDRQDLSLPAPDPEFSAQLRKLLGSEAAKYGIAVLDLSDLEHPRYGEHNATVRRNPGSVGKFMVAIALFQALADAYPDDIEARQRILRDTVIAADGFIRYDRHVVPFWTPGAARITYRRVRAGDRASLWTYLDWMLSASSNAAASMVIEHLLLLAQFGRDYPVPKSEATEFFTQTSKQELSALLTRALHQAIPRNQLDGTQLRQGSFFTRAGKARVPGASSYATPQELLRALLRLEQGKIVDVFSSREIKRQLYMTQRRIRYASSPALNDAAVYFKSGSLYSCKPEPGFKCSKYHGNVSNYMNSVAIVEAPAGEKRYFYMVTLMSNVLRKNSAWGHRVLATRLHQLIKGYHERGEPPSASSGTRDHPAPQ